MKSDFILKTDLNKHQKLILDQLSYETKSVLTELSKEGFSISYLAEHTNAVHKYFNILKKEFRI